MKFAIVDVETTGGDPKRAAITEVGAVLVENGKVTSTFETLVNPGRPIPTQIQSLTGITNEMVEEAPSFEDISDSLASFLNDAVFVAHHVLFDYRFIRESFQQIGVQYEANKRLCTARYARKLFPKLEGYSLAKLCAHFNVVNTQPHRALPDAQATAELFIQFLERDDNEVFKSFFKQRSSSLNLPHWLTKEELKKLPNSPGVYRFFNEQGRPIYIGKAKNLYKRVQSHFTGDLSRVALALNQVSAGFEFEETGSELMAQLVEDHEIRHYWPVLNRAQKVNTAHYHVVFYRDREGQGRLGIHRKKQCLNSIKQFYSLYAARNWLIKQVERYGLNPELCHVSTWSEHDFATEKHESGLTDFLAGVQDQKENYVLLLDGRTPDENGFVWIENDLYKGTGYVPKAETILRLDELELYLIPRKSSTTAHSILESYRSKQPKAKYLNLDSFKDNQVGFQ